MRPDNGPYPPGAATNTLTVQTRISPGKHGSMFTEGAVPEIRYIDMSAESQCNPIRRLLCGRNLWGVGGLKRSCTTVRACGARS